MERNIELEVLVCVATREGTGVHAMCYISARSTKRNTFFILFVSYTGVVSHAMDVELGGDERLGNCRRSGRRS